MKHFDQYQFHALATAGVHHDSRTAKMNWALGLTGEAGEVANKVKKQVLYADAKVTDDQIADELGDVLWYLTALAKECGYSLQEIAEMNVEKLKARHGGQRREMRRD